MRTALFVSVLCILSLFGCNKILPSRASLESQRIVTKSVLSITDTSVIVSPPTHKAIRITITSLEQLRSIEQDSSLVIYHYCSSEDADALRPIKYSPTRNPLKICDAEESPDIDLYPVDVYWPIDKNVPDSIQYRHIEDVFIPNNLIIEEADVPEGIRANKPIFVNGQIRAYDNRLNSYVPVAHARIQYLSTPIGASSPVYLNTYTDSLGNFTMNLPELYEDVELILQNPNFYVRDGGQGSTKTINLGTIGPIIIGEPIYFQRDLSVNFFLDVFQAAHYYYYGSNELLNQITRYTSTNPIDIFAINTSSSNNTLAFFDYSSTPYITVYNPYNSSYSGAASKIFGTVLHELGHATHYSNEGSSVFNNVDGVIIESFASFFGWINVKFYYSAVATTHGVVNSICTQGRQTWEPLNDTLIYTPFYIDLYDNYNQLSYYYPSYDVVNDSITDVPVTVILGLAFGHTSFTTVCSQLATYINQYFSYSQHASFIPSYSIFL